MKKQQYILAIFCIIVQKSCHHPYSCNFEKNFLPFFCNITKNDCAKFYVKRILLLGYTQWRGEGHYVPPTSLGMIRQKYPGALKMPTYTFINYLWVYVLIACQTNKKPSSFKNLKSFIIFPKSSMLTGFTRCSIGS